MNSPSFIKSAIAAFVISAVVACGYFLSTILFTGVLSEALVTRGCLSVATLAYLIYLLKHADVSFGKLSLLSFFTLTQVGMLYWWPEILFYALVNIAFIWLTRAIYYHSSVVLVLGDFCACVISMFIALAALIQSQSLFMCLWSFFLAQAFILPLSIYLQSRWFTSTTKKVVTSSQRFYQAHRQAEDALRKMA